MAPCDCCRGFDCSFTDCRQSQYVATCLVKLRHVGFLIRFPDPKRVIEHLGKLVARTDLNALIHRGRGIVTTGVS